MCAVVLCASNILLHMLLCARLCAGTWRHVDVSNNNVTTGSALVVTEIMRCLGKVRSLVPLHSTKHGTKHA